MDIIKKILATVSLVAIVFCADAAERRIYPCHRLAQAPVIDGKLDEEAWKNMPEATGFYIFSGGGEEKYAIEKQTSFKAGWKDDALYIAVRSEENAPEKMVAKLKDGGDLWSEDSIELFFFPKDALDYSQLVVNSLSSRLNVRGTAMDWEAKVVVGKAEWVLELRVPFSVLMGKTPKEGDEWPVNIARNIRAGTADETADEYYTSWPFLVSGFNDLSNFGRFVFKGEAVDRPMAEENGINRAYIQYMRGEIKKLAGLADKYEKDLAEARKSKDLYGEAEELSQIWKKVVMLSAQSNPDIRDMRVCCANLKRRSDECIARHIQKVLFQD